MLPCNSLSWLVTIFLSDESLDIISDTVVVFIELTQPALVLAVTEYTVVVVGLATTLVPVVALKLVFGDQLYVFLSVKVIFQLVILP